MEPSVDVLFSWVREEGKEMLKDHLVLLAAVRLLRAEEKKTLFSLVLQEIHRSRLKTPPVQLLEIGIVREAEEWYVLDPEIRKILLEIHTERVKERILVQTQEKTDPRPNERYTETLFKVISNREGGGVIRQLMKAEGMLEKGEVTHKGFNFLLESKKSQIWALILAHLRRSEKKNEIFALCEILTKNPRRIYVLDRSENRTEIIGVLNSMGLLSLSSDGRVEFSSEFSLLFGEDTGERDRFLILESNFRIYLYGDNRLNIFITSMFAHSVRSFPGMTVGFINDDSARKAFDLGITAGQIKKYLVNNSIYKIDGNVLEQLHLWESKRKRITSWPSYLFSNFLNHKDFQQTESFCKEAGMSYISYKDKRILVVAMQEYERVKEFIRANIK